MQIEHYRYQSPLGELFLTIHHGQLAALEYEPAKLDVFVDQLPDGGIRDWLDAYFAGGKARPMPPYFVRGTDFQRRVWQAMSEIPPGQTRTYGEIAQILGSAPRAVGQACKRNHIPIIIPCHRVVGRQTVGGYEGATSGYRLDRKSWLLHHEKNHSFSA
jgi:methylated-DNA-[protein]-cysteine S-methyltransferase